MLSPRERRRRRGRRRGCAWRGAEGGGAGDAVPDGVTRAVSVPAADEALLRLADIYAVIQDAGGCGFSDFAFPPPEPLTHEEMLSVSMVWAAAFVDDALVCRPKASVCSPLRATPPGCDPSWV